MYTHEQYVSLETAKLLKQVGFDWDTACYYNTRNSVEKLTMGIMMYDYNALGCEFYSAPTQSVVLKWLREVYDCCVWVEPTLTGYYRCYFGQKDWCDSRYYVETFNNYEEAVEAGIEKVFKRFILPNKEKEEEEKK